MERRVFVTGFGPFPGIGDNPSSVIAEQTDAEILDLNLEVSVESVESAAQRYYRFFKTVEPKQRPLLIQIGVSRSVGKVTVEKQAKNWVSI